MTDQLEARVRHWIDIDPDPTTRSELEALVADGAHHRLAELFGARVAFGTAGLRAALGPGPSRMNRLVVRQTTAGLMSWFAGRGATQPVVVVGFDARHGSAEFARDAAGVIAARGGRALLLPHPLPTPVLARAVLSQQADAGVMITASHNPPADNGYKLYLDDGIQLVAPADAEIASAIDEVAAVGIRVEVNDDDVIMLGDEVAKEHLSAIQNALLTDCRSVSTVYTAMHGVAGAHLLEAFERAGFPRPAIVADQFDPDPDFPTVSFPNPEEPGALDLALQLAEDEAADLVLANDPDGDRLALAVPNRNRSSYAPLSGDQIGVLLADHLLRHTEGGDRLVAVSLVSSRLLSKMATAAGVVCDTTLTGFKWVARSIVDKPDMRYLMGYEEAIGYCVGDSVRDKDGISAALVAAEIAAEAIENGITVWDHLDRLALEHGHHLTAPISIRFEGGDAQERMRGVVKRVAADPPLDLAGSTLRSAEDLAEGRHLPSTPGSLLLYDDETRVIIRPSGTEPKIKAYIEVIELVESDSDIEAARARGEQRLARIRAEVESILNPD